MSASNPVPSFQTLFRIAHPRKLSLLHATRPQDDRPMPLLFLNLGFQHDGCVRTAEFPVPHPSCWNPRLRKRSEEHTSELQSQSNLVCRLLLEKKKKQSRTPLANKL